MSPSLIPQPHSQQLTCGYATVFECQLTGIATSHTDFMLLMGGLPSLHVFIQDECTKGFGVVFVFGQNGNRIGDMGVGHKAFAAVKNKIVSVFFIR